MRIFRAFILVLLPLIALALGWQLGATYEMKHLQSEQERIANLFTVGSGSGQTVQSDPEKEVDLSLLWSVWRLLNRHYVSPEKLETRTMVYGAVSGLVSAIGDPYTLFMTPQDMKMFENALSGTLESDNTVRLYKTDLSVASGSTLVSARPEGPSRTVPSPIVAVSSSDRARAVARLITWVGSAVTVEASVSLPRVSTRTAAIVSGAAPGASRAVAASARSVSRRRAMSWAGSA